MGSLDENGIYVYDANDQVVPLATLLNQLSASVSAAIDDVRADNVYRHMVRSTSFSVSSWTVQVVSGLSTVRSKNFPNHTNSAFLIPREGRYIIGATISVQGGLVGRIGLRYRINGSIAQTGGVTNRIDSSSSNTDEFRVSFSESNYFAAGDIVEFQVANWTNSSVQFAAGGQRNIFTIDYIGAA